MKRQPRRTKKRRRIVRMWTHPEALAAVGYIRSIINTLREQYTEVLFCQKTLRELAERHGRPDRATLIHQQETEHQLVRVREAFNEARAELESLGISLLDPTRGLALIPFIHDDQLAWYVFDLFDPKPLRFWRYPDDPSDTRRPVATLLQK